MTKLSSPAIVADSTVQFRLRAGETPTPSGQAYVQACRTLAAWAKVDADNKALVHALVHVGWCSTSGARKTVGASSSKAWEHAQDVLTVGEDAAEAAARIVQALREAGAPADQMDVVWATFTA